MAVVDRNMYKEVGRRLYNMRTKSGYSRAYVAEQIQISAKFLYDIENGKKGFTVQVLYNLAKVFGTTCDYILSGEEVTYTDPKSEIGKVLQLFSNEDLEKIAVVLRAVYAVNRPKAKEEIAAAVAKEKN